MAATHRVNLPVAKGVTVETSPDGKQTALLFKTSTEPGFVGIALNNAELVRMVSLLLSQAAKVAARVVPKSPPTKMTATPILASHLGFAKGRSDSEATMHDAAVHDREDGSEKAELIIVHSVRYCSRGEGFAAAPTANVRPTSGAPPRSKPAGNNGRSIASA